MTVESLITQHIDTWTSAVKTKSTSGRGSSKKLELYGVKKLRELILELAVRGKLVPQDPSDEPASVLLERIAAEKAQLVKDKKIKKSKALPSILDEDISVILPNSWVIVRLGDICTKLTDGSHNPAKDAGSGYPMFSSQNVHFRSIDFTSPSRYVDEDNYLKEHARTQIEPRDILLTIVGTLGRAAVVPNDAPKFVLQRSVAVLQTKIDSDFLTYFLASPTCIKYFEENGKGTAQKGIYLGKLSLMPVFIPSREEQHRIVAKVDELMALCDQLEQQTEASIEAHQLLVCTLLNTLTNSADADELMENWARISDHFDTLFTTEESIDQLKQTILQLAIMGKLVPQDPNDEPASVLLERIAEEKAQLIKEKKIKKQKALPPITDDEKPFDLPNGWEWARLSDIANVIDPNPSHRMPKYVESGIPFISTENFTLDESINFDIGKKVTTAVLNDQVSKFDLSEGAFAMSRIGTIGKTRFLPIERNYCMSHALCVISPLVKLIDHQYLKFVVSAESSLSQAHHGVKSIGVPDLGMGVIRSFLIPIPPKTKQELIVINVESLLTICENLKNRLKESQITQLHLTDAIVEQAV
ncbi:restriction endonuclease subunit S [Photobacterium damselae]|uniref:restriction endonuclease subunit S n=1 Tax=Photobacterium damselae TaxID=38293 RepID=UPI001EFC5BD3|nr:restriction endonuclease subunit S [Photobacterium damselae]MCG9780048.1 restriction endonuclease subunit S [Photobacterium damselae]